MRTEQAVFDDLSKLCTSPGYIHAIAYFCFRDSLTFYKEGMQSDDMQHLFSEERLIRTETSTLLGLAAKDIIDFSIPSNEVLQYYIKKTELLMAELHESFSGELFSDLDHNITNDKPFNPFTSGALLREPIFYGGESAYSFQYRDLSPKKYAQDDEWLKTNKGFSIYTARDVAWALGRLLNEKATAVFRELNLGNPANTPFINAYTFDAQELANHANINSEEVGRVLQAFALPPNEHNLGFKSISDYNLVNSAPLIPAPNNLYVLLNIYSFVESLYESPFFWMGADRKYVSKAMKHRGQFTEEFATDRLALVFGKEHVFPNVDIFDSKGNKLGEIDVLVIFDDRIIVLQAKSKRLTIEARKGNDLQIRDDFKKSIQDSCDQAYRCGSALNSSAYTLKDARSNIVVIPCNPKSIYVLCLVSDHYPALSFQSRQFLTFQSSETINPPFVLDVFTLDSITEMLNSPLQLLSYIDRRTLYYDRFMATHESVILSYHLKKNLWLEDDINLFMLTDDVASELDAAMTVRREGIAGNKMPDGILTRLNTSLVGQLIRQIEAQPNSATIDLGYLLLSLNEKSIDDVSNGIRSIIQKFAADGKRHDLTIGVKSNSTGLTIHFNDDPSEISGPALKHHCQLRKYRHRAKTWFGICIDPYSVLIRFAQSFDYDWKYDADMDDSTRGLPTTGKSLTVIQKSGSSDERRIGRNDPCPCGSGKKFKRCCFLR